MKFLFPIILFWLSAGFPGHAQDGDWKTYVNQRFGFSLEYPSVLVASSDPVNGSGREYHTPDNQFSIATAAHFLRITDLNESLDSHWQEELTTFKSLISYKTKGDSWYVVSGVTTNGYVFYHKFFTKGSNWTSFHITYPKSQKAKYDPWVSRIEKRFVPFLKGKDYDRAEPKGISRKS